MRRLQGKNVHSSKLMKDLCGRLRSSCLHIYRDPNQRKSAEMEGAHAQPHRRGTQGTNVLTVRGQTAIQGSRHGLSEWPCASRGVPSYFTIRNATVRSITQRQESPSMDTFRGRASKQPNSLKNSLSRSKKPTPEASCVPISESCNFDI